MQAEQFHRRIYKNTFLTKEDPMKRIIILGMVSVMMLLSIGGCLVGVDVDDRDGRHHRDGDRHRDGDHHRDQRHDDRH